MLYTEQVINVQIVQRFRIWFWNITEYEFIKGFKSIQIYTFYLLPCYNGNDSWAVDTVWQLLIVWNLGSKPVAQPYCNFKMLHLGNKTTLFKSPSFCPSNLFFLFVILKSILMYKNHILWLYLNYLYKYMIWTIYKSYTTSYKSNK